MNDSILFIMYKKKCILSTAMCVEHPYTAVCIEH